MAWDFSTEPAFQAEPDWMAAFVGEEIQSPETLHAAWKIDTHGAAAARSDVSLIEFYGAQVLPDVIDRALQAGGGLGYSTDMPLEAMYRYARGMRFHDGPDDAATADD